MENKNSLAYRAEERDPDYILHLIYFTQAYHVDYKEIMYPSPVGQPTV